MHRAPRSRRGRGRARPTSRPPCRSCARASRARRRAGRLAQRLDQRRRAVGRAVVDVDDLVARRRAAPRRCARAAPEARFLVEDRARRTETSTGPDRMLRGPCQPPPRFAGGQRSPPRRSTRCLRCCSSRPRSCPGRTLCLDRPAVVDRAVDGRAARRRARPRRQLRDGRRGRAVPAVSGLHARAAARRPAVEPVHRGRAAVQREHAVGDLLAVLLAGVRAAVLVVARADRRR